MNLDTAGRHLVQARNCTLKILNNYYQLISIARSSVISLCFTNVLFKISFFFGVKTPFPLPVNQHSLKQIPPHFRHFAPSFISLYTVQIEISTLVHRLTIASPSLLTINNARKGRGQGHVTHNILGGLAVA